MMARLSSSVAGLVLVAAAAGVTVHEGSRTVVGDAHSAADGNVIWVGPDTARVPVRLWGTLAPRLDEECDDLFGRRYSCGLAAARALFTMIARDRRVTCEVRGRDAEYRAVAVCRNGEGDLGGRLVAGGWATDDPVISGGYYREYEEAARGEALGMHGGGR